MKRPRPLPAPARRARSAPPDRPGVAQAVRPRAARAGSPRAALAAALVLLSVAAHAPADAQAKRGQPKPITREWTCDNGRTVQVNYHPRRIREPAWLTYLGNRVEIARARVGSGIAAASADNKVRWHESGDEAHLEYDGLLEQPLRCESKSDPGKTPKSKSK